MGNYNSDRFRGGKGGSNFRGGGFRGGRDHDSRPGLQPAVCSNCGKDCMVPFKPTGSKPVYCNDCFDKFKESDSRNDYGNSRRFDDRSERRFSPAPESKPTISLQEFRDLVNKVDSLRYKIDKLTEALVPQADVAAVPAVEKKAKSKPKAKKATTKKKAKS